MLLILFRENKLYELVIVTYCGMILKRKIILYLLTLHKLLALTDF